MNLLRNLMMTAMASVAIAGHAANGVTVSGGQGAPGSQVEITVELSTDAADVAGAEIHIPLPAEVTPVTGSCVKSAARLPEHAVKASVRDGEYVIVLFSLSSATIPAGSGEAVRFKLDLGENPGNFSLTPTVKLSSADGTALACTAAGGTLTVLAARMVLGADDVDFGRVPIRSTHTRTVSATNTGTAPLAINGFTTDVPGLTVTAAKSILLPGASTTLTLTYQPMQRAAAVSGRFTAVSNSAGRAPYTRVTSVPFSVNELHTGSAQGVSDTEVTIALTMNNMEPIVGAEVTYKLPDALDYVAGSVEAAARARGLKAVASVDAQRQLRLVLFGLNNTPVEGEDGELLSFRLLINGTRGTYYLTPASVKLVNAEEENMVSASSRGSVTVQAPSISGDSSLKLGDVPLSGSDTFYYTVRNYGSAPLRIERVMFLNDVAVCPATMPVEVPVSGSVKIPVKIVDPKFGPFATTMNIYSNDPANRLKTVAVSGNFYSPNELSFSGYMSYGAYTLITSLANEAPITAMQMDIVPPEGTTVDVKSLHFYDRASDHMHSLTQVSPGRYRALVFSLNNTPLEGTEGPVFHVNIHGNDLPYKTATVDNVKLSGTDGVNYTTPASDVMMVALDPDSATGLDELDATEQVEVMATAMNGTVVLKARCPAGLLDVALSNLPAGAYILTINGRSHKIVRK